MTVDLTPVEAAALMTAILTDDPPFERAALDADLLEYPAIRTALISGMAKLTRPLAEFAGDDENRDAAATMRANVQQLLAELRDR
jgi:hypothetical protein